MAVNNVDSNARRDTLWPWVFVSMFAVVFIVNGLFIYYAAHTFTGLTTENSYQKGLAYNTAIEKAEAQKALKWKSALEFTSTGAKAGVLNFTLKDDKGQPITGAKVTAKLMRPTHEGYDSDVTFEATKSGYRATLALPLSGAWDVHLVAQYGASEYRAKQRIVVK